MAECLWKPSHDNNRTDYDTDDDDDHQSFCASFSFTVLFPFKYYWPFWQIKKIEAYSHPYEEQMIFYGIFSIHRHAIYAMDFTVQILRNHCVVHAMPSCFQS